MSRKILIIGFVWPEPSSSAAGNRMMQLITIFLSLNYKITFVSTAANFEYSENLDALGINIEKIELNNNSFDFLLHQVNPEIVLFDRFLTEEQFGWRVSEHSPNAMKILDTEDLHSLRHYRHYALKNNMEFSVEEMQNSDIAKRELASIYRCDLSLFVSEYEINVLEEQYNVPSHLLYYLPIFTEKKEFVKKFNDRSDFVFVGNFLHEPNWDAIKYLKEHIWPLINYKLRDAKMLVYGAYTSAKVFQLHSTNQNFLIMGRALDALEVVENAKVVLAPLRFGAGIKGKLLEAMQCGTPSITTSIGAESMCGKLPWNGFIENKIECFAEKACQVYEDEKLWNQLQQNGFEILQKRYRRSDFEEQFIKTMLTIYSDLKSHRNKNFIGAMLQHNFHASTKYMSKWIEEKNKKL